MKNRDFLIWLTLGLAGCAGSKMEPPAPVPATRSYPLVGVVTKIDAKAGRVTLRHEAVPGYMDAMTMPFAVAKKGRESLEDLQVGDKVSATLQVTDDHLELDAITVTEPAPPAVMKLDMSGASPVLREQKPKLEPGAEVPDFAVTLQDGSTAKLADFRGKVVVLTFVYTRCPAPDFCPLMDSRFAELAKLVSAVPARADRVRLLSISFDPEHDTPEVLTKHARMRGAKSPLWQYAVASHDELRKVAEPLGLTYGPRENEITHNLSTAVIGPTGRLIALHAGSSWKAEDLFKEMRSALPE